MLKPLLRRSGAGTVAAALLLALGTGPLLAQQLDNLGKKEEVEVPFRKIETEFVNQYVPGQKLASGPQDPEATDVAMKAAKWYVWQLTWSYRHAPSVVKEFKSRMEVAVNPNYRERNQVFMRIFNQQMISCFK